MSHSLDALEPARGKRPGRAVFGLVAVVVPLVVAVALAGPRLWHSVSSEPSAAVGVASLPAQQPAAATQLPVERPPSAARGQLASLDRFAARDPFSLPLRATAAATRPVAASPPPATPLPAQVAAGAPAVVAPTAAPPAAASAPAALPAPGVAPGMAAPVTAAAPTPGAAPTTSAPPTTSAAPTLSAATISINGVPEAIGLNGQFPAANPLFRLIAFGADEVQIGVIARPPAPGDTAGAPAPGTEQTVTLVRDRALTLLDTATGARYEIRLVALA